MVIGMDDQHDALLKSPIRWSLSGYIRLVERFPLKNVLWKRVHFWINGPVKHLVLEDKFAGPCFLNTEFPHEKIETMFNKLWHLRDSYQTSEVGRNFQILVIFGRFNYKTLVQGVNTKSDNFMPSYTYVTFKLHSYK